MIHFWRKPGKTLIYTLTLFMTASLLYGPVYAENEGNNTTSEHEPAGETPQDTNNGSELPANGHITVKLPETEPPADLVGNPDLITDFYLVAKSVKDPQYDTYTYQAEPSFSISGYDLSRYSGTEPNTEYLSTMDQEKWEAYAQEAATIVRNSDVSAAVSDAAIGVNQPQTSPGLIPGIYLVLAHKKNASKADYFDEKTVDDGENTESVTAPVKKVVTTFYTETNKYCFSPILISIPYKDVETTPATTDDGAWIFDVTVFLKPSSETRFGKLTINKQVQILEDRLNDQKITPMTAVFRITGWSDNTKTEKVYSNVASITVPDGEPVTLDRLPIGAYVEVEEIYTGAGYRLVNGSPESVIIASPDQEAQVEFTFTNTYTNELKKGYGVMNSFTKAENTWTWKNDLNGGSSAAEGGTE